MCGLIPEPLCQGMDAVLRAEIVVLVDATTEICKVVDQVVGAMRDEQSQRENKPGQKVERLALREEILPGQQPADDP